MPVTEFCIDVGLASIAVILVGEAVAVHARKEEITREFPIQAYGTETVDFRILKDLNTTYKDVAYCSLLRSRCA